LFCSPGADRPALSLVPFLQSVGSAFPNFFLVFSDWPPFSLRFPSPLRRHLLVSPALSGSTPQLAEWSSPSHRPPIFFCGFLRLWRRTPPPFPDPPPFHSATHSPYFFPCTVMPSPGFRSCSFLVGGLLRASPSFLSGVGGFFSSCFGVHTFYFQSVQSPFFPFQSPLPPPPPACFYPFPLSSGEVRPTPGIPLPL